MTVGPSASVRRTTALPATAWPRAARVALACTVALATYAWLMHLWEVEPIPGSVATVGVALSAVSLLPLAIWYARGRPGIPMFELICLSYGVQYTLPLYLDPNSIVVVNTRTVYLSWDATQQALLLVTEGLIAMIVSYYAAERFVAPHLPRVPLDLEQAGSWVYIAPALSAGMLNLALSLTGHSPSSSSAAGELLRVLSFQAYVALAILAFWHYRSPTRNRVRDLVLLASTVLLSALGLTTGLLEASVSPFAIVLIARWVATRRFPWHWALAGLLIFATFNSVKGEYRVQVWHSSGPVGLSERATTWLSLADQQWQNTLTSGSATGIQSLVAPTAKRLDLLHVFSWIYTVTPSYVPYFEGRTYTYLLYGWIPRFIFPDKPNSTAATQTFEADYALLMPSQLSTASIGAGHAAEAYANFGALGVIIVMALQGVLFAVLRRLFDHSESDASQAVYLASLVVFLNGIGSYTAITISTAVEDAITSTILVKLVALRNRAAVARRAALRAVPNR